MKSNLYKFDAPQTPDDAPFGLPRNLAVKHAALPPKFTIPWAWSKVYPVPIPPVSDIPVQIKKFSLSPPALLKALARSAFLRSIRAIAATRLSGGSLVLLAFISHAVLALVSTGPPSRM